MFLDSFLDFLFEPFSPLFTSYSASNDFIEMIEVDKERRILDVIEDTMKAAEVCASLPFPEE